MTLRKFLRFFKHFPRYMAYDVKWLVKKISGKGKKTDNQTVPKKFVKVLNKIKKKTGTDHAIKYTTSYYIAFKNKPYSFYSITRNGNTVTVTLNGKVQKQMKFSSLVDGTIGSWIETVFKIWNHTDCAFDAELFAIRLMTPQHSILDKDDDGTYKVYVKQGNQPLRLRYRISYKYPPEIGEYIVYARDSNKGKELTFHVPYDPMLVLNQIPH